MTARERTKQRGRSPRGRGSAPGRPALMLVALSLLGVGPLVAQDAPHWSSTSLTIDCTTQCHTLHQALGSGLTSSASNVNLCQSCHNPAGLADGQPISNIDKAVPDATGTSHAFDVDTVHGQFQTQDPLAQQMLLRVMGGQVVCSTCHNQHKSEQPFGGTSRVSPAEPVTALGSTGLVTSGGLFTGAEGVWYLVEISTAGNQATAEFRYSKDNGTSWFPTQSVGAGVPLDSGVTVSFGAGSYVLGERWEFSGAWPFLRTTLDAGNNAAGSDYCRDCHRTWVMDHTSVETYDGSYKSHPVGVGLDANGQGYDRSTPLDGNGADQGAGGADTNPTNDLPLDGSGNVQCLSCHAVHYADSNTQTVDGP